MARKRLNKKVALIGSAVFTVFAIAAILVILHLSQGPEKFITDGDQDLIAAREALDPNAKEEYFAKAARNYLRARARAKTDSLKVDILYKLTDLYLTTGEWRFVRGCWNQIIELDPESAKARYGRLKFFYIQADTGGVRLWQEIATQASGFIEIADQNMLDQLPDTLESFAIHPMPECDKLGTLLYLLKGRATYEVARQGAVTDQYASISEAIDDLEEVLELAPTNVDASRYLANALLEKAAILTSRGDFKGRDQAEQHAEEILQHAVEVAEDNPKTHINLLLAKPTFAQLATSTERLTLEPEYLSLVREFPSSPQVYQALARFYQHLGYKYLDQAIEAAGKAVELDKNNVRYAIMAADLYYKKFSIYKQPPELGKALEVAQAALELPDAQQKGGPRNFVNKYNRISLFDFLANAYLEQVLEPAEKLSESQSLEWISKAEQAVHQIEQLRGSGEAPQVVKWRGMLEFAKGNKEEAARKMYSVYEQFKSAGQKDSVLSYWLAKILEDTIEIGAVRELLFNAVSPPRRISNQKPEALLDFADVMLRYKGGNYNSVLNTVDFFEQNYWSNKRSQNLRVKALIGLRKFDKAQEQLTELGETGTPETIRLELELVEARISRLQQKIARSKVEEAVRLLPGAEKPAKKDEVAVDSMTAQLQTHRKETAELVEELLRIDPNFVPESSVTAVCNDYVQEDQVSKASDLVNQFLQHFPENMTFLFLKQLLAEPQPDNISQQRRKQIKQMLLSNISDPVRRTSSLGVFYINNNEPNKAVEEFKKILGLGDMEEAIVQQQSSEPNVDPATSSFIAASFLLDNAINQQNWLFVEQITTLVRRQNLDRCEGNFLAAKVAIVKKDYKDALAKINEALRLRPVFSYGLMVRSEINAALGNEYSSIQDARKAASLNPLDGTIARTLAVALYRRNESLGLNISSGEILEVKNALALAISLNPREWELLSFYAEYISDENPEEALAIRQRLLGIFPNVQNTLLLARMATRMGRRETNSQKKEVLFDIAESAFEQAYAMEPENKAVLNSYAEYYRQIGQPEKAEQLFTQAQNSQLLWVHYFQNG